MCQSPKPSDLNDALTIIIIIIINPTHDHTTVTLKVLGTARNALLVVASVYLFSEVVSPIQFLG